MSRASRSPRATSAASAWRARAPLGAGSRCGCNSPRSRASVCARRARVPTWRVTAVAREQCFFDSRRSTLSFGLAGEGLSGTFGAARSASSRAATVTISSCRRAAPAPYRARRPRSSTRASASPGAAARRRGTGRGARKPWARKRPSRRCTTRCSRCRWTTDSSSVPGSWKTTGRSGASPAATSRSLVVLARGAQRVERRRPRWDRRRGDGRGRESARSGRLRLRLGSGLTAPLQLEGARERVAEVPVIESNPPLADAPVARAARRAGASGASCLGSRACSSSSPTLSLSSGGGPAPRVRWRAAPSAISSARIPADQASPGVLLEHRRQAAQLARDGVGLLDQRAQHAILGALR